MAANRGAYAGAGCALLFLLAWSSVVVLFDCWVVNTVYKQLQAVSWPAVPGRVVAAEVVRHPDSEGDTYEPRLEYIYEVAGERLSAWRIRFGNKCSSQDWANEMVRKYPAGSTPDVHYNPDDVGESVLETGVSVGDLTFGLFILPFNFIAIGFPLFLAVQKYLGFSALECPEWRDGNRSGLDIDYKNPVAAAWVAGFLGSLALIPAMGLLQMLNLVGFGSVALGAAALVILCVGAASKAHRRNRDRSRHAWVDSRLQTLHLPGLGQMPWTAVRGFAVEEEVYRDSDGDEQRRHYVQLLAVGEPPRRWKKVGGAEQARAVADWLNDRLDRAVEC